MDILKQTWVALAQTSGMIPQSEPLYAVSGSGFTSFVVFVGTVTYDFVVVVVVIVVVHSAWHVDS